jgi:prepilin-type N-terminal cleavage/methylation domain-containing protein
MDRGFTLLEVSVVLSFVGVLAMMGAGAGRGLVDQFECRAAREEVAALIHRARAEARLHGEARVRFSEGEGGVLLLPGDSVILRVISRTGAAASASPGSRTEATLVFGPLGVGRAASTTLYLERGRARLPLVLSSHGRVRR